MEYLKTQTYEHEHIQGQKHLLLQTTLCLSENVTLVISAIAEVSCHPILFCQFLAETHPREFETSMRTQPTNLLLYVCSVPCKNKQQFFQHTIRHQTYAKPQFTAQSCGYRIVSTRIQLTIKFGASCRSVSTANSY